MKPIMNTQSIKVIVKCQNNWTKIYTKKGSKRMLLNENIDKCKQATVCHKVKHHILDGLWMDETPTVFHLVDTTNWNLPLIQWSLQIAWEIFYWMYHKLRHFPIKINQGSMVKYFRKKRDAQDATVITKLIFWGMKHNGYIHLEWYVEPASTN